MKGEKSGGFFKIEDGHSMSGKKHFDHRTSKNLMNETTYITILKEIETQKNDFESRFEKIKKFLEGLEVRYFEQNKELLLKLFIHEISCNKNVEYDLNRVIEVR